MYNNAFATYNIVTPPEGTKFEVPKITYPEELIYPDYQGQPVEQVITEEPIEQATVEKRKFKRKSKAYDHTISFKQLCDNIGVKVRITSEYRAGSKTKSGKLSNHGQKDEYGQSKAIDVVPVDGDFEKFKSKLLASPEARNWFKKRGYGIINEVTSQALSATGGSGKHFHIGPDKWAQKVWNTWLQNPGMSAYNYIKS